MTDDKWLQFFRTARETLGKGDLRPMQSESWCAWTTFASLHLGEINYWKAGLPDVEDIQPSFIGVHGLWGQTFRYCQLAHIIIPAEFFWESAGGPDYTNGTKCQDIAALSRRLQELDIPHRLTNILLEIKLY